MSSLDLSSAPWRKSSWSGGHGECVEVADLATGYIAVRDSKNVSGPALVVGSAEWSTFINDLKGVS